ncbi:MAG TPA: hypothetical protein VNY74_03450, partial [Edaphobacter sp.]|nr:hypothetical protein [Edaphobacter sp.]
MSAKYVFVTGGVVSSLGKGLAAASIGCLLESRGLRVNMMKFDPYLNVDPGTMSPFQHGEVFVTDDGAETDLDLGHYERFTHARLSRDNNLTTGQIYSSVIAKERKGEYLGKTVQVVPHITNEIKERIKNLAKGKGLAAASIGCLLETRGLKVNLMKFDPYLNVDPGTMSPFQHGEVFVTDDGAETDLDLGHYERFTHARLTRDNNLTTGRIYEQIITKERRGDYLGKTVQVIPHVTNEIKNAMRKVAADCDILLVEI